MHIYILQQPKIYIKTLKTLYRTIILREHILFLAKVTV